MKNGVFWFLEEPHSITSQKMPFFSAIIVQERNVIGSHIIPGPSYYEVVA
jgi:hypothetical protein